MKYLVCRGANQLSLFFFSHKHLSTSYKIEQTISSKKKKVWDIRQSWSERKKNNSIGEKGKGLRGMGKWKCGSDGSLARSFNSRCWGNLRVFGMSNLDR